MSEEEFWELAPFEWIALHEFNNAKEQSRAHNLAAICSFIANFSYHAPKKPFTPKDLLNPVESDPEMEAFSAAMKEAGRA